MSFCDVCDNIHRGICTVQNLCRPPEFTIDLIIAILVIPPSISGAALLFEAILEDMVRYRQDIDTKKQSHCTIAVSLSLAPAR